MNKLMICAVFFVMLLLILFSGCEKPSANKSGEPLRYSSYLDIPGVTDDEIQAIENLRAQRGCFVYGVLPTTEAFHDENGNIRGYSAVFCEWLTGLFGISFKPEFVEWDDYLAKLASHEVDFSGYLTATEERRKIYFMTTTIAQHAVRHFRLVDSMPLEYIAEARPLRYAFIKDASTIEQVTPKLKPGTYEIVLANDIDQVHKMLRSGEADAFINEGMAEASFDIYGDVVVNNFYPLLYRPVSLATQNQALEPVISVVQKALDDGAIRHLTMLYNRGHQEYLRHKFFTQLTEEERSYIKDNPVVPYIAEYDNYPISFYNAHEKEWQGIAIDILREVEALSGLSFERINDSAEEPSVMLKMLESGEAALVTELIRVHKREGRFIWPRTALYTDYYALISKSDYPYIEENEVLHTRVGLIQDAAHTEVFQSWFPEHRGIVLYNCFDAAFAGLARDEVDMIMASQNMMLVLTNFREQPGYKANIVFDLSFGSSFGFNKDQAILCTVVDKALRLINPSRISGQWMYRTYDYRAKVAQAQIPWLIGASFLLLCVLILLFVLFQRNRQEGKILEDLVRKHTAEASLRAAKLEAVITNYKGIIWSVSKEGVITTFNGQYLKTIGIAPAFFEGKNISIARLKNRHLDIIANVEKTLTEGPQDWSTEFDGGVFRSCTVPLYDGDGKIIGVVGSTDDMTETVRLQRDLENASRAKSNFLSNMSHEIRTPLNAIIGMTAIGMAATEHERMKYCLSRIDSASNHLRGVINDILDMSKIEANKFELSSVRFNFEKMLQKVVNVINFRLDERRQHFHVKIDKNIPSALIGDDQRLAQVITNLLSNSVKFTPEDGSITLDSRFISEEDGVCRLQISVTDTGIGINDAQKARLFRSFEQAEADTSRKFGGTGLGLAISKRIVEMMGGNIEVESEPGRGSTFTFTVMLKNGDDGQRRILDAGVNWNNIRIFAVDDESEVREYFMETAASLGIACTVAASGEEAADMLAHDDQYDIFFVDCKLPGMNGIEFAQRVRSGTAKKSVVILFSSTDWNVIEKDARAAGVDKFLQKPLFRSGIVDAINEYMGTDSVVEQTQVDYESADFTGHTVLLVEDVEVNREIVLALLEPTGINVECAENGVQALKMFGAAPDRYDMIFMDVQMPEMDGYEATRAIRAFDAQRAKTIPIIAMTANVFREDIEKCLNAGMNGHVGKPLDVADIFDKLRTYIV